MALQYGMNIPASNIKNMLEQNDIQQNGVRTWRQLLGGASQSFAAKSSALKTDYSDAISKAYRANLEQMDTIAGSSLSAGANAKLTQLNREELAATYQKYIQGYTQDASALTKEYADEVNTIEGALNERAENYSNLFNKAYTYLTEELALGDLTVPDLDKPIFDKKKEKPTGYENKVTDYLSDYGLDWMRDEQGNMLTWNDLAQKMFNEDGSLNEQGVMFYDAIFNAMPQGYLSREDGSKIRSFDEWLSETDTELRDWVVSQDIFNYNAAGTNRGTANLMTGRDATDVSYGKFDYIKPENFDDINMDTFTYINNEYQDILNQYESAEKEGQGGGANILSAGVKAGKYKAADNAWNKYKQSVITRAGTIDDIYKKKLGTKRYEEYRTNYKDLFDRYDTLLQDLEKETNGKSAQQTLTELQNLTAHIHMIMRTGAILTDLEYEKARKDEEKKKNKK